MFFVDILMGDDVLSYSIAENPVMKKTYWTHLDFPQKLIGIVADAEYP